MSGLLVAAITSLIILAACWWAIRLDPNRKARRDRATIADYLDQLALEAQGASFKNRNVYDSGATAWLQQEARKLRAETGEARP